jgi:hypothetical protein
LDVKDDVVSTFSICEVESRTGRGSTSELDDTYCNGMIVTTRGFVVTDLVFMAPETLL